MVEVNCDCGVSYDDELVLEVNHRVWSESHNAWRKLPTKEFGGLIIMTNGQVEDNRIKNKKVDATIILEM